MQAFVTLPKDVEEGDLVKLEQNIYWSRENKKFYKSSILPSLTLLDNDNLIKRQNIVFTKYDPSFLVIKELYKKKEVAEETIPYYLGLDLFLKFGQLKTGKLIYNQQKIYNFIQSRIDAVEKVIKEKQYEGNDVIKMTGESDKKKVSNPTIEIVKNDVPFLLLEQILMKNYECEKKKRGVILDRYEDVEEEQKKEKKKKSVTKTKTAVVSRDQSLLTKFIKKKE